MLVSPHKEAQILNTFTDIDIIYHFNLLNVSDFAFLKMKNFGSFIGYRNDLDMYLSFQSQQPCYQSNFSCHIKDFKR
jgi:hypothetical protein